MNTLYVGDQNWKPENIRIQGLWENFQVNGLRCSETAQEHQQILQNILGLWNTWTGHFMSQEDGVWASVIRTRALIWRCASVKAEAEEKYLILLLFLFFKYSLSSCFFFFTGQMAAMQLCVFLVLWLIFCFRGYEGRLDFNKDTQKQSKRIKKNVWEDIVYRALWKALQVNQNIWFWIWLPFL